ncbi:hypothetical protein Sm713_04170 [Streptomyces sp. TS71-3]|nr:hypothetical protein Sm713_04170 [Streptomyces sp. TS71-3]
MGSSIAEGAAPPAPAPLRGPGTPDSGLRPGAPRCDRLRVLGIWVSAPVPLSAPAEGSRDRELCPGRPRGAGLYRCAAPPRGREQPATGRWSGNDSDCPLGTVTT